jgi:hypothetical protein
MKKKILDNIYKKLTEAYKIQFIPLDDFEQKLADMHDDLRESLCIHIQDYTALLYSENHEESSQVVKVLKDDYILERFKSEFPYKRYTIENLDELRNGEKFIHFSEEYFQNLIKGWLEPELTVPFTEFLKKRLEDKMPQLKSFNEDSELDFENILWRYIHRTLGIHFNSIKSEYFLGVSQLELLKYIDKVLESFRLEYIKNEHLLLLSLADKYLNDVEFSGFETFIINVGTRNSNEERSGWITNKFNVVNNSQDYNFMSSSKDEKPIGGHFIHIFILHPKHLEKISVTIKEVEQTKYIIAKEIEKLSIKNECEVLISKHHGNETIIFDSRKEALNFQNKILEIKEGKRAK